MAAGPAAAADAAAARWHVERLPHLGRLVLSARLGASLAGAGVGVSRRGVTLGEGPPAPLPAGARPRPHAATVSRWPSDAGEWVQVCVPLEKGAASRDPAVQLARAVGRDLPAADELDRRLLRGLWCRFCGAPLAAGTPTRALPLPSPHWQELTDLWFCHSSQHIPLAGASLAAREGDWLLGETHVQLPAGAASPGALSVHECGPEGALVARCRRCDAPLGEAAVGDAEADAAAGGDDDGDDRAPLAELRLEKSRVRTAPAGERDAFAAYTAEGTAAHVLVAACEARARYQFVLRGHDAAGDILLVALLGWDGLVGDSEAGGGGGGGEASVVPAVKVRYLLAEAAADTEASAEADAWLSRPGTVDVVVTTDEALHEVARCLAASTRHLPPACRRVGNFEVGFLRRIGGGR